MLIIFSFLILRSLLSLQIRDLARQRMFGKPGHGAPTQNVRKKIFTEYQLTRQDTIRPEQATSASEGNPDFNWTAISGSSASNPGGFDPHHNGGHQTNGFPSQRLRGGYSSGDEATPQYSSYTSTMTRGGPEMDINRNDAHVRSLHIVPVKQGS